MFYSLTPFYVFQWSFTHCPTCSFKSTIHVSLHILIIYLNIWYYVQYVYSFLFLLSGFIFSVYFYYYLNLLYRPFYLLLWRLTLWEFLTVIPLTYWFDDSTVSIGLSLLFINFQSTYLTDIWNIFYPYKLFSFFIHIRYKWYLLPCLFH